MVLCIVSKILSAVLSCTVRVKDFKVRALRGVADAEAHAQARSSLLGSSTLPANSGSVML